VVERSGLVVGFDLDLTLIDTAAGVVATLEALAAELGVAFPSHELASMLGPPLDHMLAPYLPAADLAAATDRFRAHYPDHAVAVTPHLAGALAAGALSVSVLTGGSTREELVAAGTHVVLDDLTAFPAWLDEHLRRTGPTAPEAEETCTGSAPAP
jgi:phosphoglycolate phosphatase-like HAD superfamily hydrolase